jgi:hypothetical protein
VIALLSLKNDAPHNLFWELSIIDQCGEKRFTQYHGDSFKGPNQLRRSYPISIENLLKNDLLKKNTFTLSFKFSFINDQKLKIIHENKFVKHDFAIWHVIWHVVYIGI